VGGSLVVSPFGDVVAAAGADPQLLIADVALERVAKAREDYCGTTQLLSVR